MEQLFNPPGFLHDFERASQPEPLARTWSDRVSGWFDKAIAENYYVVEKQPCPFFNPIHDTIAGAVERVEIPWQAFPQAITPWFSNESDADTLRWKAADTLRPVLFGHTRESPSTGFAVPVEVLHRQQDEYCEWFVHRDHTGRITRVDFSSEAPEYWELLFEHDPNLVIQLYREFVSEQVKLDDLVWPYDVVHLNKDTDLYELRRKGTYNRWNPWTTSQGIMHLTHPDSTLSAELYLASDATVLRADANRQLIIDQDELICCSGFGKPNRSSDPSIGARINYVVRQKQAVSLADPVGVYIKRPNLGLFEGPNGEDVSDAWKVLRGDAEHILRASFQVPAEHGFIVADVKVDDIPITFGGQIADQLTMVLNGIAAEPTGTPYAPLPCRRKCCSHPSVSGVRMTVEPDKNCTDIQQSDWNSLKPLLEPSVLREALRQISLPSRRYG